MVTDRGRYTADRVVLTAGAWIGQLAEPLRVRDEARQGLVSRLIQNCTWRSKLFTARKEPCELAS